MLQFEVQVNINFCVQQDKTFSQTIILLESQSADVKPHKCICIAVWKSNEILF